jgi:RNA polymerase sigma-70 factor, ECF subfamily
MTETITTQILIGRVQAGDGAALNELCARYQQRVLSAVRIRLGAKLRRKIESCDVVQEVMMAALGKVNSFEYRTEGAFLKYLNHLVENRLRDEADRQGAARRNADREIPLGARSDGDGDPLGEIGDPSAPTPSRLLILGEDLARMERAMDRLSPEYRELIVAVKLEGQTYRELAEGTTEDAIRMKVNRAEQKLAAIYHELEAGER